LFSYDIIYFYIFKQFYLLYVQKNLEDT
jgi:hypothetical protein